jgi:hypothetical protein
MIRGKTKASSKVRLWIVSGLFFAVDVEAV